MIVAIVNQTVPVGVVVVDEFREAVSEAQAVTDFVNSYTPPRNPADYLGFDTGWGAFVSPGAGAVWGYDFGAPGLVAVASATPIPAAEPTGYARGCRLSWTSASQVSIATGRARAASDDMDIEVTAVLVADITVAGAGGLDAGGEAASTWYAVYVISDLVGAVPVAALLSASFAAPALPAGYLRSRRIGSVRNNGASDFIPFVLVWNAVNRRCYLDLTPATSQVLAGGVADVFTDVSLAAFVPPTARHAILLAEFAAGVLGAVGDELRIRPNGFSASAVTAPIVVRALLALATKSAQEVICACPGQIIEYRVTDTLLNSADISVVGFDDEL